MHIHYFDVLPSLLQVIYQCVDSHDYVTLEVVCLLADHAHGPVKTENLLELDTDCVFHLVKLELHIISWLEWKWLTVDLG